MPRYLTPMPHWLAGAVERALARSIDLDEGIVDRLQPLEGKLVKLQLNGIGIDLFFRGCADGLNVTAESDADPDASIAGTPVALLAMAVPDWRASGSGVRVEGDAGTAQAFEKLLRQLDPDWEAAFVEHLGPVVGHQLWRLLDDARAGARHLGGTAADQAARYLREESGLLVTRGEVDEFVHDVDELREATDRLEARLRRRGRS